MFQLYAVITIKKYDEILVNSLKRQSDQEFELIGVDNTDNRFSSAASALNYGAELSKTENLLFVHQDFEFSTENSLKEIKHFFRIISDNDVLGAAGAIYDSEALFKQRFIGRNRINISTLGNETLSFDNIRKCESVDECCFGLKKELWNSHHFDENVCFGWDLYGVEMCLYCRSNGGNVYVIPFHAIHHSGGKLSPSFYDCLKRLTMKYSGHFERVVTTCVVANTRYPRIQHIKFRIINLFRR